jgi:hypothetical protein
MPAPGLAPGCCWSGFNPSIGWTVKELDDARLEHLGCVIGIVVSADQKLHRFPFNVVLAGADWDNDPVDVSHG